MKNEINEKIAKFKSEVEKAKKILVEISGVEIKNLDIQLALAVHFNAQHSAALIAKDLSTKEIVEILKDFDFSKDNSNVYDNWIKNIMS